MNYNELEERSRNLVKKLLDANVYLQVQGIADTYGISKRSVYYDVYKINEFLNYHKIDNIAIERGKGLYLSDKQKAQLDRLIHKAASPIQTLFTPQTRFKILICSIINKYSALHIEDFMNLCAVSRNTIIKDLKVVAKRMDALDLKLIYEHKVGYFVKGDMIRIRAVYFFYFSQLSKKYRFDSYTIAQRVKVYEALNKLQRIEKELQTRYAEDSLFTLANLLPSLENSEKVLPFSHLEKRKIKKSKEYSLVHKYFPLFIEDEKVYVTLHLLGTRLEMIQQDVQLPKNNAEASRLSCLLIEEFTRIACVEFDHIEKLKEALYAHLQASLYRYRYGIQLGNPLVDDIRNQYPDLFEITKKASAVIRKEIALPISDNEIAYLTLHFGAFLTVQQNTQDMNILIVCPNGISTGNMLRGEVMSLVTNATKITVVAADQYRTLKNHYTVTISTMFLEKSEKNIVVNPILSDADRISILKKCLVQETTLKISSIEILNIVRPYVKVEDIEKIEEALRRYIKGVEHSQINPLMENPRGLLHYLMPSHVQVTQEKMQWETALQMASIPLLKTESIEKRYVDEMIHQTKNMGTYMFISEDVMLAHAKSEDGARKVDISLTLFHHPPIFENHKKARIILVLSATDKVKHLKILSDIMQIFSDKNAIKVMKRCDTKQEVLQYLHIKLS
ncbi:MAG: BglG family transcription antiterminator [Breznakia sp.]